MVPDPRLFLLPEKVLQFGTGVLLRGLPDCFIAMANSRGMFNGRVVVIKSTGQGDTDVFAQQDGLYTHCIRGVIKGREVQENIVNPVISRVLSAQVEWPAVLELAGSKDLQLIISNTTEVGITLEMESIFAAPPRSFPGKLLAFLYERYRVFNGDPELGLVIIPTELIPDNAQRLLEILRQLAGHNKLGEPFADWLTGCNHFCSSLVDRIVPGKMDPARERAMHDRLGYTDELMIMSEAYGLWAIETDNEHVKSVLNFSAADPGVILAPDISRFRTLKLRLLNGSHTFCCALAMLQGFATVREAMADPVFHRYIRELMLEEIVPAITDEQLGREEAIRFAEDVLDRYSNPFLDHQWQSITLQYSSKMRMRNVPLILAYTQRMGQAPVRMAKGFAAYLLMMSRAEVVDSPEKDVLLRIPLGPRPFILQDQQAALFLPWLNEADAARFVRGITGEQELWGTDLNRVPGFTDRVLIEFLTLHHLNDHNQSI